MSWLNHVIDNPFLCGVININTDVIKKNISGVVILEGSLFLHYLLCNFYVISFIYSFFGIPLFVYLAVVRSPSACFGGNLHAPGFRSFRRVALRLFHFWILRRLKHGSRAFHEPRAPYVALHINIVQCLSDRRGVPIPLAISVFCNQSSWNVIFVHMWYFSMCLNCMVIFEIIYVNSTVILQNYFLVFKVTSILCWWKYKYIIKSFF